MLRLLGDYAPLTLTGLGELLVREIGTNPSRPVDRVIELGLVSRVTPDASAVLESVVAGRLSGDAIAARARHS